MNPLRILCVIALPASPVVANPFTISLGPLSPLRALTVRLRANLLPHDLEHAAQAARLRNEINTILSVCDRRSLLVPQELITLKYTAAEDAALLALVGTQPGPFTRLDIQAQCKKLPRRMS